jgi:lysophospholipid acyltransferase (LPLAT)-like uncharacterized protein
VTRPHTPRRFDRAGRLARGLAGLVLGLFVRVWLCTLRIELRGSGVLSSAAPLVFAFWHGDQMLLARVPRRRSTVALVSWSRDGDLQRGVLTALGFCVVRGSTSRAGAAGLKGVVRALSSGSDAAFAVDGPKGPNRAVKPGAAKAASLAGAQLVPVGSAGSRCLTLARAWDHFLIPLPFSRVVVVLGEPLLGAGVQQNARVASALSSVSREAALALARAH